MSFALTAEPVEVDRSEEGTEVELLSTSDPRRAHLEGLTGTVKARALGVLHVEWANGEFFALAPSDDFLTKP